MSDPSDNQPRKLPSPIPILIVPSQAGSATKPEPMIIGTPIDPAPPANLVPAPREPRSPSLSPIHRWRRRWSHNMHSVLSPCSCTQKQQLTIKEEKEPTSKKQEPTTSTKKQQSATKKQEPAAKKQEPSTSSQVSEFPLVRTEFRKRPRSLVPVDARVPLHYQDEVLKYAPASTHMDSMLIRNTQCFLVSSEKAVAKGEYCRKLGTCVMFRQLKCEELDCFVKCPECKVCPHLFKCNCIVKYMGTSWCPHLHVMQERTQGKFLAEGLMFIHDNWKFTEMRHLRAFIQGDTKMQFEDGLWVEQFQKMMRSHIYRVKEQSVDECSCLEDKVCPLCDACLCKYACTCEDFCVDGHVCEHIHNVAMQKHPKKEQLFKEFREFGSGYRHSVEEDADPNLRYYIEQEHQMSFYFDVRAIKKQERQLPHATEWHMKFPGDDPPAIVVKENLFKDRQCYCHTEKATKANSCVRCQICDQHYTCNCGTAQFTICRHIHAVVRLELSRTETPEQRFEYLRSLISRDESLDESKFLECLVRSPLGPVHHRAGELVRQFSFSVETLFFPASENVEL